MKEGFGKRLNAAMLAAGMTTPAQLAEPCRVSRRTVEKWLKQDRAKLSSEHLDTVCSVLHIRFTWLLNGTGAMPHTSLTLSPHSTQISAILDRLAPAKLKRWLAIGQRMADEE